MTYRTTEGVAEWDFAHTVKHSFSIGMVENEVTISEDSDLELDLAAKIGMPPGVEFRVSFDASWSCGGLYMSVKVAKEPEDIHVGFKMKASLDAGSNGKKKRLETVPVVVRKGTDGGVLVTRRYELNTSKGMLYGIDETCDFDPTPSDLRLGEFIEKHARLDAVRVAVEIELLVKVLPGRNSAHWNFRSIECTSALAAGLRGAYLSSKSRDFVLVASDGKEIPVHRLILEARSPVFAAMFAHDMKESREGRCVIPDVTSEVLRALVKYLYGFPIRELGDITADLMVAAEKYDVARLKELCGLILDRNLESHDKAQQFTFLYEF